MQRRSSEVRLLGCFVCAVVSLALLGIAGSAGSASRQDPQQPSQQQRPRKVGATPTPGTAAGTPQQPNTPAEEVDEGDVVRVETQLVTVPAVVTDRNGRPLSALRVENFVVLEDGKPQRLTNFATTEAPFEIALLLDTSGSTREELGLIREAANLFISALRAGDRVAILAFNNAPGNGSPIATVDLLSSLTGDRKALRTAIENLGTSNGTPFYDALGASSRSGVSRSAARRSSRTSRRRSLDRRRRFKQQFRLR